MKTLYTSLSITFFISLLTASQVLSQSSSFPRHNFPIIVNGQELSSPYVGGFNNPQPQNIDLNNDGIWDIVVYDRDTECVKTFLGVEDGNGIQYVYSPEYEHIFPPIVNFIQVLDFNKDGIADLFVGYKETGIPGIHVYRGRQDGESLYFELMEFSVREDNLLTYRSGSGNYLVINTSPIDLPSIADVDGDGDVDVLTFQPGMGNVLFLKNEAQEKGLGLDTIDLIMQDICYGKFYESDVSEQINLSPSPDDCAKNLMGEEDSAIMRHAGSTTTSIDLNGDGLNDLLVGDVESNRIVALYNGGSKENAWMTEQDPTFPSYDKPIDLNEFLSAFVLDVDQDGKQDILVAPNLFLNSETRNNIHYYRQEIREGKPVFIYQDDNFLYENQLDLSSHAVPVTADINGDGLLDIIVGTYGDYVKGAGRTPSLHYFENTGTAEKPEFTLKDDDFLNMKQYGGGSWGFAPTFGDLDGDGDLDLIVGDYQGKLYYFENIAGAGQPMDFAPAIENFMDIKVSHYAAPQIVDINKDGLGDIIIGEQTGNSGPEGACGSIVYFQNIGEVGNPQFNPDATESPNTQCFGNVFTRYLNTSRAYTSPQLLEVNGELRLITGDYEGNVSYYAATESPYDDYELVKRNISNLNTGRFNHPHIANLDNDEYYDLIVGTLGGGLIIYKTNWKTNGEISGLKEPYDLALNMYPNPASSYVTINVSEGMRVDVLIYDTRGVLVKSFSDVETSVKCRTDNLADGMYIVKVVSGRTTKSKKLVIQR